MQRIGTSQCQKRCSNFSLPDPVAGHFELLFQKSSGFVYRGALLSRHNFSLPFYFFRNALNKSIGSGRNVVVLCSLAISRMVWR